MTTIYLSTATKRNNGKFQVFGNYDGADDRYTFGVRSFAKLSDAEAYAEWMVATHEAAGVEKV